MTIEVARNAIDTILQNRKDFSESAVTWDFIGGEPFLEIELIDKICDYIKIRMYELNHPWFNKYIFNFSSNGILFNDPRVQEYIQKNKTHVRIGISGDDQRFCAPFMGIRD